MGEDILQGSHSTGKTGKMVKCNSRQGKHREFENFGQNTGDLKIFLNQLEIKKICAEKIVV